MTYVSEWGKTFNAAAVAFTKDISATTKGNKSQGAVLKKILEDAQSPMGVVAALAALDKIDITEAGNKDKKAFEQSIKLFKSSLKKFEGEMKKYVKDLVEAQNQKPTVSEQGFNIPTPMKKALPATYRQLKILQTEVEATYARAANALGSAETLAKVKKNIQKGAEKKDKVKGSDDAASAKLKSISEETAMKNFVIAFGKSFKSSVAKGAACIQKIKASPDVATYNEEMWNCGRDISQNLLNIDKLKKNPKFKGTSLAKKLPDPGAMARDIVPYANGDLRKLPATATDRDVKKALADFTALYKSIVTAYKDVISGKIK